jgi:hypothetical protein
LGFCSQSIYDKTAKETKTLVYKISKISTSNAMFIGVSLGGWSASICHHFNAINSRIGNTLCVLSAILPNQQINTSTNNQINESTSLPSIIKHRTKCFYQDIDVQKETAMLNIV